MTPDEFALWQKTQPSDSIEEWRKKYDEHMERCRQAVSQLRAPRLVERMSAEDCAFLWNLGIRVDEDIERESFTI